MNTRRFKYRHDHTLVRMVDNTRLALAIEVAAVFGVGKHGITACTEYDMGNVEDADNYLACS
jgi:hypothetical protein